MIYVHFSKRRKMTDGRAEMKEERNIKDKVKCQVKARSCVQLQKHGGPPLPDAELEAEHTTMMETFVILGLVEGFMIKTNTP